MRTFTLLLILPSITFAQAPQTKGGGQPRNEQIRKAMQLDADGKYGEARTILEQEIANAADPAAKAAAQRVMALSWAFENNCGKAVEYLEPVIAYWKTQEQAAPGNAFYQQGEMANEAARICIEAGELGKAFDLYQRGRELGQKEPNIAPARMALWDYRWEHALARIAARRNQKALAEKHVASARGILDSIKDKDAQLHAQQAGFFPYLTGYVALYTGDYRKAIEDLNQANQGDPFYLCLLGMAHDKLGEKDKAREYFEKASKNRGHNPPAAFAHYYSRKALASR
jgi:tetratricopeptide (TPR) repeat protein